MMKAIYLCQVFTAITEIIAFSAMLKTQWNRLKVCVLGQVTSSPENIETTSNFEGFGLTLVTYKEIQVMTKKLENEFFLRNSLIVISFG